jgi:aminotransferase
LAARTLLNPGEEALVLDPSYVAYEAVVNLVYAQPKYIPVKKENRFKVLPEQIQRACGKKTKVLILNYPANPTGASYTKKELTALRKVILQKNLFVISDEIYDELSYDYAHTSLLSLPQMKARCLYVNGFSKTYAMTGWRVGFACGPKEVIAGMTKIHQFTMLSAPTISQMAAIEALKNSQRSVLEMKKEYHRRRDFMLQGLNKIGLSCHRPEGAFYLFPSIAKTKFSSMEFCQRLLKEEKVAVVPGTAFGEHGEGHIRISYASSMENLKEALLRMERFLKRHQDEQ